MFWRFGFASTSTLDTLLEKSNLTIEELLDEDDLLQECKAQNGKLVDFLSQKRIIKRLFEHVVGVAEVSGSGGKEWEEKVRFKYPYVASEVLSSEIFAIVETVLANPEDLLDPFWNAILHSKPGHVLPPQPHHSHPLLAGSPSASPVPPGKQLPGEKSTDKPGFRLGSRDGKSSSSSSLAESNHEDSALVIRATDNGPGKSVLAGYWAKVNGVFLDKKPREMLAYIRDLPRIVERFVAHLETPAAVDLLYRIISCEQTLPAAGVIEWLSSHDLIPKMVELLSPKYSIDLHNTVSELLKAIIALSAPSPAGMTSGQDAFGYGNSTSFGGQEQVMGVQNKLVRELASEPMVRKMVSFMLDSAHGSELTQKLSTAADERTAAEQQSEDAGEEDGVLTFGTRTTKPVPSSFSALDESSAIDDADDTDPQPLNPSLTPAFDPHGAAHRDSTATVRPTNFFPPVSAPQNPITRETSSSSLITGIGIFIELIRKNNSDYFEQHLFHALRSHLLQRQQEIAAKKAQARSEAGATGSSAASEGGAPASSEEGEKDEEEEEMEGMEEAMLEMTDKLGIVHLGPMLTALCERLSEFQALIERPSSAQNQILTTLGKVNALSFERYRIAELYAELLHCSNMALLNRPAGDGPHYSSSGVLQGGIQGLQVLARTLQGADADDTSDTPGVVAASAEEPASPSSGANGESSMSSSDGKPPSATPQGRHARQASTAGASEDDAGGVTESDQAESDPFADEASAPESTPESDHPQAGEAAALAEDAKSIRSALSSMSLANLTTPQHSEPPSPMSDSAEQVVGDLLKKKFLDCDVIPTILSLFFEYPWNNFFHNVVYDILQQCFNGRMDAGLNRKLTVAVFEKGRLPEKILEGQQRNNDSTKGPRRIRLGYMGHLNLIAEETVKLLERYPQEIGDAVSSSVPQPAWDEFVNESLKENREKESAPLAGGKPMTGGFGFGGASANQGSGSDDDGGRNGAGVGQSGDNETFANYLSAQMGGTSSDDDDSDEEASWLTQDPRSSGFADAFQPGGASSASVTATTKVHEDQDDDDDEWGPFSASEGGGISSTSKFDFQSSASQPLTSADWAASAFDRSNSPGDGSALDDSATGGEDEDGEATSPSDEHYPFVDLSDATSYRIAQASAASLQRRRSSGAGSSSSTGFPATGRRRASSSAGSGSTDPSAAQAVDEGEPMGPGVSSKDTEVKDGMLIRKLSDGSTVSVPLDDVALAQLAEEQKEGSGESALEDD